MPVRDIGDVAARNLCAGCGACAYLQPDQIAMVDDLDQGRRPLPLAGSRTTAALAGCPGVGLAHPDVAADGAIAELLEGWGPVLEVWEGHAADPAIRFAGSSGGAATALSLHGVQALGMHGVLHTAARRDVPYLNHTVLSRTRAELLESTGSRYAPASPCDGLQLVEDAPRPCVFIGKPCDVAGAHKSRALRPALDAKLGLTIAIFCAGTPSTRGTLEMLDRMGVTDLRDLRSVRYRGNGWPGPAEARIVTPDGGTTTHRLTYEESWGEILQKHRQWRCHVCADHTGEFADVAVGDPWYRDIPEDDPGRSLLVVRTDRGRQAVRSAVEAGALIAEPVDHTLLAASQPNLLMTRGAVWGRTAASRALGVAAPRYVNIPTYAVWRRHLSAVQKLRSLTGTVKRIVSKRLYRRRLTTPVTTPTEH